MLIISSILRRVAEVLKNADAEVNLRNYLKPFIRDEFLKGVFIAPILNSLPGQVEVPQAVRVEEDIDSGEASKAIQDPDVFNEDMVVEYIKEDMGEKLQGKLISKVQSHLSSKFPSKYDDDMDLLEDDALKIIVPGGVLSPELRGSVSGFKEDIVKLIYSNIQQSLVKFTQEWSRDTVKQREEHKRYVKEELPTEVLSLPDEAEQYKKMERDEEGWKHGLLEGVRSHINKMVDGDKTFEDKGKMKNLMAYILNHRIVNDDKTVEQIVELSGYSSTETISKNEKKLRGWVTEYLRDQPAIIRTHPNILKQDAKDIDIPKYTELLKDNTADQADLKSWIKSKNIGSRGQGSENTSKVIDVLCDGKSISETSIITKVIADQVKLIKSRYFNKAYEEWYMDKLESIRTACRRIMQAAKTVRIPAPGTGDDSVKEKGKDKDKEEGKGKADGDSSTGIHKKMVETAISNIKGWRVQVNFHSDFDHSTCKNCTEGEEDPNFGWESVNIALNLSRNTLRGETTINYTYDHELSAEGKIKGDGTTSLLIDGHKVEFTDPLYVLLNEYVKNTIVPVGVITYEAPHNIPHSVQYINTKLGKTYYAEDFKKFYDSIDDVHQRLFYTDEAHDKRLKDRSRIKERKWRGLAPMDRSRLQTLITSTEDQLKNLGNNPENNYRRNQLKLLLTKYKILMKDAPEDMGEDRTRRIEEMRGKEKLRRQKYQQISTIEDTINKEQDDGIKKQLKDQLENMKKQEGEIVKEENAVLDEYRQKFEEYDSAESKDERTAVDYDSINRYAGVILPPPTTEGSKAMVSLLEMYKHSPDAHGQSKSMAEGIRMMPQSRDLVVLAGTFRMVALSTMKERIEKLKKDKKVNVSKGEWSKFLMDIEHGTLDVSDLPSKLKEITEDVRSVVNDVNMDIAAAQKHFPEFVHDYKNRVEEYRQKMVNDSAYKGSASVKDVKDRELETWLAKYNWVHTPAAVDKVIADGVRALKEFKVIENVKQPVNIQPLGFGKFDVIESFARNLKTGLKVLGDDLGASYDSMIAGVDYQAKSPAKLKELKDSIGAVKVECDEMLRSDPNNSALESFLEDVNKSANDAIPFILKNVTNAQEIPALRSARSLMSFLKMFSDLYSVYWRAFPRGMIRSAYEIVESAEVQEVKEDVKTKPKKEYTVHELKEKARVIRDKIVSMTEELAGIPMGAEGKDKKNVVSGHVNTLRTDLKKYIGLLEDARSLETAKHASMDARSIVRAIMARMNVADTGSAKNESYILSKYSSLSSLVRDCKDIIAEVGKKSSEDLKIAQGEYDDIVNKLGNSFQKELPKADLERLAKEFGMTPDDVIKSSKKHEQAMSSAAFKAFAKAWASMVKGYSGVRDEIGIKKGNKYPVLADFIMEHIPALSGSFKEALSTGELSDFIRDKGYLKKDLIKETDADIKKFYDDELGKFGFGGGGGGGGKSRAKAVKDNPPSMAWEVIKDRYIQDLKSPDLTGREIVENVLFDYAVSIEDNIKSGKFFDPTEVAHAMVALLKTYVHKIPAITAYPSKFKTERLPMIKLAERRFVGKPDIPLDAKGAVERLYTKIVDIYNTVNEYIGPDDHVGPSAKLPEFKPGQGPGANKPPPTYMPYGLTETFEDVSGDKEVTNPEDVKKTDEADKRIERKKELEYMRLHDIDPKKVDTRSDRGRLIDEWKPGAPLYTGPSHSWDPKKKKEASIPGVLVSKVAGKFAGKALLEEAEAYLS